MKCIISKNPELMGLFGLSWEEKIASYMLSDLRKSNPDLSKKMKMFTGAGGVNTTIAKNLHNEYAALLAKGKQPAGFSDVNSNLFDSSTMQLAIQLQNKTNLDLPIIYSFLRALWFLAKDGKIPYAKWNPSGFQESTELRKTFPSERGFVDIAKKSSSNMSYLILIAAIGVTGYLISQVKSLKGQST